VSPPCGRSQRYGVPSRRDPREDPAIARSLATLAEVARALRLTRGWSLEETAERADMDVRHVQLLERGAANPTTATLLRVARGFGVSVEDLFRTSAQRGTTTELRENEAPTGPRKAAPIASSDEALAHRVKSMRLARDWSQHELAAQAGVSQGAVQAVEARTKSPTLRTLDALAAAFGLAPHELLAPAPKARMPRARAGRR
jgi:transcriptional regulator with XRE-family HTH domain